MNYLTKFGLKEKVLNVPRVLAYEDMLEDILFKLPFKEISRPKIYNKKETLNKTNKQTEEFFAPDC